MGIGLIDDPIWPGGDIIDLHNIAYSILRILKRLFKIDFMQVNCSAFFPQYEVSEMRVYVSLTEKVDVIQ